MDERDILKTELRWGAVVAAAVALIIAVIVVTGLAMALHPPSNVELVSPTHIHLEGEFAENNLGAVQNPDGSVTVRVVATQFTFLPRCIPVPVDRPVTLRITSPDVIHGLIVAGTNVNTMVIPGYVAEINTRFRKAGDHLMPCHEYCGLGHSEMWSIVRVMPQELWLPNESGRVACDIQG